VYQFASSHRGAQWMTDVLTRASLLPSPTQLSSITNGNGSGAGAIAARVMSMDDEQRRVLQFLLRPLVAMHDIRYPETRDRKLLENQARERAATQILKQLFETIAPGVTAQRDPLLRVGIRYMAHHGGQPPSLLQAAAAAAVASGSSTTFTTSSQPVNRRISHGMYAPIDLPELNNQPT
jgi:hypothetical protein